MYKVNRSIWFWLYLGVLVPLNLIGQVFELKILTDISKPMLLPCLAVLFFTETKGISSKLKIGVFGAIIFSWVGDIALMYDEEIPVFFIVGLCGFLIAHLNYLWVFIKSKRGVNSGSWLHWIGISILVVYTLFLLFNLWPYLGEMKVPVFVYALVLFGMGVGALIRKPGSGYNGVLVGAILFIISDSILALNKFRSPIHLGGFWVMLNYTLAQVFIVLGLVKIIISKD